MENNQRSRHAKPPRKRAKPHSCSEKVRKQILCLYGKGLSQYDIRDFFQETEQLNLSAKLIESITDLADEERESLNARRFDRIYPIVYIDGLVVNSRHAGFAEKKTVYVVLGINMDGQKEVLGLWMGKTEQAKYWLVILNELKSRGLEDIFILCCDNLKGLPQAVEAAYPQTKVQLCIVHQIRNSFKYVPRKAYKAVSDDLRNIYGAATLASAEAALEAFAEKWDADYPLISRNWRRDWVYLSAIFDYPPAIRRIIYTTNMIESLNAGLRKAVPSNKLFADDEAVLKRLHFALKDISRRWSHVANWKPAMNQFAILFEERFEEHSGND